MNDDFDDTIDPDNPASWDVEEKQRWAITNDALADWALARYARAEQQIDRLRDLAAEEHARINQRLEQATASYLRDVDFFGDHLTRYHQSLIDAGKAEGTYRLMNGDLTCRKQPARVEVIDLDLVYDFDETLCRIKVEADKRKILERVKAGETVPGVELVTGEVSFKPKPGRHEQPAVLPLPGEAEAA